MAIIKGVIGPTVGGEYQGSHLFSCFTAEVGSVYTDVYYNDKGELQIAVSVYSQSSPSPRAGFMIYKGPFPKSKEDTLQHFAKMVQDALETES